MNNNESRALWISLGSGLFAAFLLYSYSQEKKAEYDNQMGKTKTIWVAKRNIAELETLDDSLMVAEQRPEAFVEPSAIVDPEEAVGQVAAVPIKAKEQILKTKLLHPGPETGIALQVAPKKRAVTIPIDDARSVAHLIRPGDRVDIFSALDVGKGSTQRRDVIAFMSDVVVLATGVSIMNNIPRSFESDGSKGINQISLIGDTKYSTITIEATPKEAQDLIYIMTTSPGNIYFTLRNPNDREVLGRMPSSNVDTLAVGRIQMPVDSSSAVPAGSMPGQRPGFPQQMMPPPQTKPTGR